jgi:hypothetical protein
VRLRPLLARYGISLVEDEKQRAAGVVEAEHFAAQPWKEAMAALAPLCLPYAHRFQSLLDVAPPEDAPLIRFMIDHELSVSRMAEREAKGESAFSSDLVVKLEHPFAYVG